MTPERWQQIEQVYHAALARDENQRAGFLREACAGDEALRSEVESLLEQGNTADPFLETPALDAATMLDKDGGHSLLGRKMGSYQVLSLLGAGGMGVVYKARDTKLGRHVAIKVLPSAFVHDSERLVRFQREARMLASLNHPNIATIHDLEQSEGVHFLVMELVPGETLAERVTKGALPLEEALKVAGQIAEALEAAHERGVIHRDLKPANVKVTPEGRVKVLDFGLAKAFAGDGTADLSQALTLSEEGRILGTPAYMSPEQARGKSVDKRTDIWAFGCLLYELLTTKQAFRGETLTDTLAAVLEREPDWQALPSSTPATVRDLLRRCLQKDSQRRLRDLGDARIEIEEALPPPLALPAVESLKPDSDSGRSVVGTPAAEVAPQAWWGRRAVLGIAGVVLLAVLAGGGWFYRSRAGGGETIDSLAVLPFVNGSDDPNMEYLSDGITETLINNLSQLPHLRVMSRESAFHYKGKETDARTVGNALGVRAVFEGRVVQQGDRLAISAELIDARDNSQIWGDEYNRKSSDIFALQGDIAKEITTALQLRLTRADEKRLANNYTANPEAYQDYLKGLYWWNKSNPEGFNKAIEYFQQAIEQDPTYALAYAGLAFCYNSRGGFQVVAPKDTFPKGREAALKALEIDETLAEAHTALGFVKIFYDWDWAGAEKELQRAIALNPNYALGHLYYSLFLSYTGRAEESIAEEKRALALDPLSLLINRDLGYEYYFARQYDQAIDQARKTLEMEPHYSPAHHDLVLAYVQKSMYKEATAALEGIPSDIGMHGYVYALSGKRAEAQKALDKMTELSKQTYISPVNMARIYAGLGSKDAAFQWLEKAYEDRSLGGGFPVRVDPAFDPLRSDPRFADLMRRMNLQP